MQGYKVAAIVVLAGGLMSLSGKAQEATPAALEQRLADITTQLQETGKLIEARKLFLQEQKPVAALKKTCDDTKEALQALQKSDKVVALVSADQKAKMAYEKAFDDSKKADAEYTELRAKVTAAHTRRSVEGLSKEAGDEIAKELAGYENQKKERQKVLRQLPAVAEAKKAADEASAAYQAFTKNDPDFTRLQKAHDEARQAYDKTFEAARTGDAEYGSLKTKANELQSQKDTISRQLAAAKAK